MTLALLAGGCGDGAVEPTLTAGTSPRDDALATGSVGVPTGDDVLVPSADGTTHTRGFGSGTAFELPLGGLRLSMSAPVDLVSMSVSSARVDFAIASGSVPAVHIVISGLARNREVHIYDGSFERETTVGTDDVGRLEYRQELAGGRHYVWLQAVRSTVFVRRPDGGGCEPQLGGVWTEATGTCVVPAGTRVYGSVEISTPDTHLIGGPGSVLAIDKAAPTVLIASGAHGASLVGFTVEVAGPGTGAGVLVAGAGDVVVERNTFTEPALPILVAPPIACNDAGTDICAPIAIQLFAGEAGSSIRENAVAAGAGAIVVRDTPRSYVDGNVLGEDSALYVVGPSSTGNVIRRHLIASAASFDHPPFASLRIAGGADGNVVVDNSFSGEGGTSIAISLLEAGDDNLITGNVISGYGAAISAGGARLTLTRNRISGNVYAALFSGQPAGRRALYLNDVVANASPQIWVEDGDLVLYDDAPDSPSYAFGNYWGHGCGDPAPFVPGVDAGGDGTSQGVDPYAFSVPVAGLAPGDIPLPPGCATPGGGADPDVDGDGYTAPNGDCDDLDPNVSPIARERCDGLDNDCDAAADEGLCERTVAEPQAPLPGTPAASYRLLGPMPVPADGSALPVVVPPSAIEPRLYVFVPPGEGIGPLHIEIDGAEVMASPPLNPDTRGAVVAIGAGTHSVRIRRSGIGAGGEASPRLSVELVDEASACELGGGGVEHAGGSSQGVELPLGPIGAETEPRIVAAKALGDAGTRLELTVGPDGARLIEPADMAGTRAFFLADPPPEAIAGARALSATPSGAPGRVDLRLDDLDVTAPYGELWEPMSGTTACFGKSVTVRGWVADPYATVYVDGRVATRTGGEPDLFEATVPVGPGDNTLLVEMADRCGNLSGAAMEISNGTAEACNGLDDDCDGLFDEDYDADGDGYTVCGELTQVRTDGLPGSADCNDRQSRVHPDAPELCNQVDDDCDGATEPVEACADPKGPILVRVRSAYCERLGLEGDSVEVRLFDTDPGVDPGSIALMLDFEWHPPGFETSSTKVEGCVAPDGAGGRVLIVSAADYAGNRSSLALVVGDHGGSGPVFDTSPQAVLPRTHDQPLGGFGTASATDLLGFVDAGRRPLPLSEHVRRSHIGVDDLRLSATLRVVDFEARGRGGLDFSLERIYSAHDGYARHIQGAVAVETLAYYRAFRDSVESGEYEQGMWDALEDQWSNYINGAWHLYCWLVYVDEGGTQCGGEVECEDFESPMECGTSPESCEIYDVETCGPLPAEIGTFPWDYSNYSGRYLGYPHVCLIPSTGELVDARPTIGLTDGLTVEVYDWILEPGCATEGGGCDWILPPDEAICGPEPVVRYRMFAQEINAIDDKVERYGELLARLLPDLEAEAEIWRMVVQGSLRHASAPSAFGPGWSFNLPFFSHFENDQHWGALFLDGYRPVLLPSSSDDEWLLAGEGAVFEYNSEPCAGYLEPIDGHPICESDLYWRLRDRERFFYFNDKGIVEYISDPTHQNLIHVEWHRDCGLSDQSLCLKRITDAAGNTYDFTYRSDGSLPGGHVVRVESSYGKCIEYLSMHGDSHSPSLRYLHAVDVGHTPKDEDATGDCVLDYREAYAYEGPELVYRGGSAERYQGGSATETPQELYWRNLEHVISAPGAVWSFRFHDQEVLPVTPGFGFGELPGGVEVGPAWPTVAYSMAPSAPLVRAVERRRRQGSPGEVEVISAHSKPSTRPREDGSATVALATLRGNRAVRHELEVGAEGFVERQTEETYTLEWSSRLAQHPGEYVDAIDRPWLVRRSTSFDANGFPTAIDESTGGDPTTTFSQVLSYDGTLEQTVVYGLPTSTRVFGSSALVTPTEVFYEYADPVWPWRLTSIYGDVVHRDYSYDPVSGKLETMTETDTDTGETAVWTYVMDEYGNATSAVDPDGRYLTFDYAEVNGLPETFLSAIHRHGYEADSVEEPLTVRFDHDVRGLRTLQTDGEGHTTRWRYDHLGRLVAVDAADKSEIYQYKIVVDEVTPVDGGPATLWRPVVVATTHDVYEPDRGTEPELDAGGAVPYVHFDYVADPVSRVSAIGETRSVLGVSETIETRFEYDTLDRPISIDQGNARLATYGYDGRGRLTSYVDARGGAHTYFYDDLLLDRFVWSTAARRMVYTDPNGYATESFEDAYGRTVAVLRELDIAPGGGTVTYGWRWGYDERGRPSWRLDPTPDPTRQLFSTLTHFVYDGRDRLVHTTRSRMSAFASVSSTPPAGCVAGQPQATCVAEERQYTPAGLLSATVDAEGRRTTFRHDPFGRVSTIVDPARLETELRWDANDHLTSMTRLGSTRTWSYGPEDRLEKVTDAMGNNEAYAYTPLGELREVSWPPLLDLGARTYAYGLGGRLVEMIDEEGYAFRWGYDADGHLEWSEEPRGPVARKTYVTNGAGEVVEVHFSNGTWLGFERDAMGAVIAETASDTGSRVSYARNGLGLVRRSWLEDDDPDGEASTFAYTATGAPLEVVTPEGRERTWTYDYLGLPRIVRDGGDAPEAARWVASYDAVGNLTQLINPKGGVVHYTYDRLDRILTVEPGDRDPTTWTYDDAARRVIVESPHGSLPPVVTTYEHDVNGALSHVALPDGVGVGYGYGPRGELTSTTVTSADGRQRYDEIRAYDARGLPWEVTTPAGVVSYRHDPNGNLTRVVDESGVMTQLFYDDVHDLPSSWHAPAASWRVERDVVGRVTESHQLGPNGTARIWHHDYDKATRTLTATAPGGAQWSWRYSADRNLELASRPGGGWTEARSYDALNRLASVVTPDAAADDVAFAYQYDRLGNLEQVLVGGVITGTARSYDAYGRLNYAVDANGETSFMYHPADGRLVDVDYADGESTHIVYDERGRPSSVADSDGFTTVAEYDHRGLVRRVTRRSGPVASGGHAIRPRETSIELVRDAAGRVIAESPGGLDAAYYANGTLRRLGTVHYGRDERGRVESIYVGDANAEYRGDHWWPSSDLPTIELSYNAFGDVSRVATHAGRGAGFEQLHRYDADGLLDLVRLNDGSTLDVDYYPDQTVKLVQASLGGASSWSAYYYDLTGRLDAAKVDGETWSFGYEVDSDLELVERDGAQEVRLFDWSNQLETVTGGGPSSAASLGYDARGNLTSKTLADGTEYTYTYTVAGLLTDVRRDQRLIRELSYDPLDRLVSDADRESGVVRSMSYFGTTPTEVVGRDARRRLVPRGAGSGPAALLVPTPSGATAMEVPVWLFESAVALSSSSGALLERYVHTPFGELRRGDAERLPFSYKGYYRLPGSDMMWAHARFYDAGLRQFMSHDPLGGDLLDPVTLNSTSAFDGDPIGKVDVLGLRDEEVYAKTTYISLPGMTIFGERSPIIGARSPVIPIDGPGPAVLVQPDAEPPAGDNAGDPLPDGIPDQPPADEGPDGFFLEADTEEGADVAATAAEISSTNARAMIEHHREASARFDVMASAYAGVDPSSLPVSALMLPRWRRTQDRWGIRLGLVAPLGHTGPRAVPGLAFAPRQRSAPRTVIASYTPIPVDRPREIERDTPHAEPPSDVQLASRGGPGRRGPGPRPPAAPPEALPEIMRVHREVELLEQIRKINPSYRTLRNPNRPPSNRVLRMLERDLERLRMERPPEELVPREHVRDFRTKNTRDRSAQLKSERDARNLARTKLGTNPVEVEPGKLRSRDGRWQYRAKPEDIRGHTPTDSPHIHIERLDPTTGEVLENWHLRWK